MSRHRFLMLGASIVGVGMLPFAQRNYAYAQSIVTPMNYVGRSGLDNPDDHTAVLYDMFSDRRLQPPYHFQLLPCPNNPEGWQVVMGKGFATFPVKSNWTLEGSTLAGSTALDPASSLNRKGAVVDGQKMFENKDYKLGNDKITFSNVYVKGNKYEWAEMNGGYFDIEKFSTFLRIYQEPALASDQWNEDLKFLGCIVQEWPGISCVFYQLRNFEVSNNLVTWSHRGSLIFRFGAQNGLVHHNQVLDGGDDCIAFNGNTDNYYQHYPNNPPPKAENVYLWANTLSEKKAGNDIPEPPTGRKRGGNSPIAVRAGRDIHIGKAPSGEVFGNEILYTMDSYIDSDGKERAAQPAVEVRDNPKGLQGQTAENIWVRNLTVRQTEAGALVVPDAGVTGGVYDSVCERYTTDPWKLAPPATSFARENLDPPDEYSTSTSRLASTEQIGWWYWAKALPPSP
jgi:hypothetical protein